MLVELYGNGSQNHNDFIIYLAKKHKTELNKTIKIGMNDSIESLKERGFLKENPGDLVLTPLGNEVAYFYTNVKRCVKCKKLFFADQLTGNHCIDCLKEFGKKQCPTCKEWKYQYDFYKNKHSKGGYHYQCKECKKKYQIDYQKKHSLQVKERDQIRYQKRKEKMLAWNKIHRTYEYRKMYRERKRRQELRELIQRIYQ